MKANLAVIFKMQAFPCHPITWPSPCGSLVQTMRELPLAVVGDPSSRGYAMAAGMLYRLSTPPHPHRGKPPLPWASRLFWDRALPSFSHTAKTWPTYSVPHFHVLFRFLFS